MFEHNELMRLNFVFFSFQTYGILQRVHRLFFLSLDLCQFFFIAFIYNLFNNFRYRFVPAFARLVSWNICLWITYEQIKKIVYDNTN